MDKITPKSIINWSLGAFPVLMIIGYLVRGDNAYFNFNTLVISLILWLIITCLYINRWSEDNPLVGMVVIVFLGLFLPRLLIYVYFPESVEFPFEQEISLNEINRGLFYIVAGTLCFAIGMTCASRLLGIPKFNINYQSIKPRFGAGLLVWAVVFSMVAIFEVYFAQSLNMTVYNAIKFREYSGQSMLQLLKALFGTDTALLAFMTYLALPGQWQDSRREWFLVLFMAFVTMIIFALNGSRGGPIRLIEFVFAILLVRGGEIKFSVARLIGLFALLLTFSAMSFSVGDYFRTKVATGSKVTIFETFETFEAIEQIQNARPAEKPEYRGLNRLGAGIDYGIYVTTHVPSIGNECVEKYLNYQYFTKSIVNYLVPGNIFSDAILNTSRVFSICYRNMSFDHIQNVSGYNSEMWTMWGLAQLMHGWWGGLIFMFFCGVVLHALYYLIHRLFPPGIAPYISTVYVFLTPGALLLSFGLDHGVNTIIAVGVQLTVVLLLYWLGAKVMKRFGIFFDASVKKV